ncbi:MAG: hypothetical protein CM15mP122_3150 [Bacteroidota bacterium]|nr:MAG: hypothetical protein CM15mP122_3150 [Bacteroidota bacterium]
MLDAISYGQSAIKDQINAQIALAKSFGKKDKELMKMRHQMMN